LAIRLLLVPIGVGVGIGIGIDSDCELWLVLTHGVASFSYPNPIFYPSIPIPTPTPTPIMTPNAIGTRLSCIEKMSKPQLLLRNTGNALPVPPAPADILDRCTHPASRPNPIFCPSIPIPIPTPTPIIIPTAIGTHLSCIENMSKHQGWAPPTSVAQQQATMVGDKREYRCRQDDCEI
jgi:hypothetical protein